MTLSDLPVVSPGSAPPAETVADTAAAPEPAPTASVTPASGEAMGDDQIFTRIERLAGLFEKGILTEAEFAAKKAELLARL